MKGCFIYNADTYGPQAIRKKIVNTRDISRTYDGKYPGNATGNDTFIVNRLVLHPINNV